MDIYNMEKAFKEYTRWKKEYLPEDLLSELALISEEPEEIYDRFCKDIAFGTSGLRGKMGAGSNRINSVVLRKASLGIARYLTERYEKPQIVIGYDTRINSREYAQAVAEVYAAMGVDACIFSQATPVPVVSFAVRHLGINGGIMITASHNTKEYNGYKVYDHFGNQIDNQKALTIEKYINETDPFDWQPSPRKGKVTALDDSIKKAYLKAVGEKILMWDEEMLCRRALQDLKVCYTPLNGSGLTYVTSVMESLGVGSVQLVESQRRPDGSFPTCPSPNPENYQAFEEALKTCEKADCACDIIIATDPDSDRLGVMVYSDGCYHQLSGNQVGELMFDYVCRCRAAGQGISENSVAFKSFVSSPLVELIGRHYNVSVKNVFTGFKNIAREIELLNEEGRGGDFLFGFEESLGYLYGDYTRDKDGVMAAQMVCLMAAEQKAAGSNLVKRLEQIYEQYGYMESITTSLQFRHEKDREKINAIIEGLFGGRLRECSCREADITREICYHEQQMYCAELEGGHRIIARPSGTELKLKIYIFAKGQSRSQAIDKAAELCSWARNNLEEK